MEQAICIYWFRRDLRLEDNKGLSAALESGLPVLPIFIFDTNIVDELKIDDPRISFIYNYLERINKTLSSYGSSIKIYKGDPLTVFTDLINEHNVKKLYFNHDYEPYAIQRDSKIFDLMHSRGIGCQSFKDHVVFEKNEILKSDGTPYTVFTPYSRKWYERLNREGFEPLTKANFKGFIKELHKMPELKDLGFKESDIAVEDFSLDVSKNYENTRNYPWMEGTSNLGPHLRFGTISVRQVLNSIPPAHISFINELVWREFFMQVLYHFKDVVTENFRRKYDGIRWRNREEEFQLWCKGKTGFPIVDAGMRQLNQTGTMHNRVRMVTASFLCKNLLIDWRWGEAYFAEKLLDYELSSNNGNWQWAAGTGCDAAPYFRVFSPAEQLKKYDKKLEYVSKWIPELNTPDYPAEIVDLKETRERAINVYKTALNQVSY